LVLLTLWKGGRAIINHRPGSREAAGVTTFLSYN
jgi:hypothetical protein